jgi:hypothetical protein
VRPPATDRPESQVGENMSKDSAAGTIYDARRLPDAFQVDSPGTGGILR